MTAEPVTTFAVTLVRGPSWDHALDIREQRGWDEHAAFMDALVAEGFILLGGPLHDRAQVMHAVAAPDEGAVRARFAEDPWAEADLLRVGRIDRWDWWLDARRRD